MQARSRMIDSALVGAALLLLGSACGGGGTGASAGGSEIRVSFYNNTGRTLSVVVDGPSFSPATVSANPCGGSGCSTDEFPGVLGDVITFDASAPAGSLGPAISGSGNCRAGPGMVGIAPAPFGADYGGVRFDLSGSTIIVGCYYLWQ